MKTKNKLVIRSIAIKEESKKFTFWSKKKHMKGEKHNSLIDFEEYFRKSDVSKNSKFYYGRFLRNGLHERYCYIRKSR